MKRILFSIALLCCAASVEAQIFYYVSFPDTLNFPTGWSINDSRIALSNQSMSSGYSPPPASGGSNVRFNDCIGAQTARLIVSGVINTTNKTDIRVGFGRRISNAWNKTVSLEWSSNGTSWNLISVDVTAGAAPQTWDALSFDLPSNAEGHNNLRFRFSFSTPSGADCVTPPNFRIDDFAVGENFSLPVELVNFEAKSVPPRVRLGWSTASETTNDYFAVEHSTDGRMFDEIGRVNGAGTTRAVQHYAFVDEHPAPGANYYRLRQEDLNGAIAYSPVRVVEAPEKGSVRVFPSPVHDILQIKCSEPNEDEATLEIFDLTGRLLMQDILAAGTQAAGIPVQHLLPGTYLWRLVAARQTWTQTFQKY